MRPVWTTLFAAVIVAALAPQARACSQCMCGTPFPFDVLGASVPVRMSYGLEERYLSKRNALEEEEGQEHENEHRIAAFGIWRPMNRLALLGRLPWSFKEITEKPTGEEESSERANGLGDAEVLAMVGMVEAGGGMPSVSLLFGITAPTGQNDKKDENGERLEQHLQPGNGAWSETAGLDITFPRASGNWNVSLLGRANQENSDGYRYGNAGLYNAGYTSPMLGSLQLMAQVNGRSAEHDRLESGEDGEHTGGTVLYAAPGLRWMSGGIMAEAQVQIPFYQSLYGDQTEHTTARLTLSYGR
jgi:hypothetical protein